MAAWISWVTLLKQLHSWLSIWDKQASKGMGLVMMKCNSIVLISLKLFWMLMKFSSSQVPKYVQLVSLRNKEAATVSNAIFNHWICCCGIPVNFITDQGKVFCVGSTEDLFKHLGISHLQTTARHPQTNSEAEVANKTIAKYLTFFVYLPPLMFSYNISFH